ncbi:MAG TPA: PaaI family thioesterase [Pusillimonas sp.]|uniref:PaaI family thioesterase n=1 Tax=Pusillimonas sp. TaxID=3040095 RepID=UPI002D14783F|nr:PaaI family thioesterase [Pusillimonas sp.]HUH88026.1 PaaI family thioesterase [Pusillimonas sp.]
MSPQQQTRADQPDNASPDYFGLNIPYMAFIGLVPEQLTTESARTRLPYRADLANSRGDVHGGALMSALDFTLSAAARAHEPGTGMATIDMTTHFLEPARGEVIIEARCLRIGASLAFCEGQALDLNGKLLATASATFKIVRRKRTGQQSV